MPYQPFDIGRLVESRVRVAVDQVVPVGSRRPICEATFLVEGKPVRVVRDSLGRYCFACPDCGRRCKHIYFDGCACRICLRLDWECRHRLRTPLGKSARRAKKWRKQIGVDPQPFAHIPRKQRHHKRYFRVVGRILEEEGRMLGELRRLNRKAASATIVQPER